MIDRGLSRETVSNLRFLDLMGVLDDCSTYNLVIKRYLQIKDEDDKGALIENYLRELETYINPELYQKVKETEEQMKQQSQSESSELVSKAKHIRPSMSAMKAANDILNMMDNSKVERGE